MKSEIVTISIWRPFIRIVVTWLVFAAFQVNSGTGQHVPWLLQRHLIAKDARLFISAFPDIAEINQKLKAHKNLPRNIA